MGIIQPQFRKPTLRTVQISYHCDMTRDEGAKIPLGVMCDFVLGDYYGLALMARKRMIDEETAMVGRLIRASTAEPFDMLLREYDIIAEGDDAERFVALPQAHHGALTFAEVDPVSVDLPIALHIHLDNEEAVISFMEDRLASHLSKSYWNLLDHRKNWIKIVAHEHRQNVRLRAA